MHERLEIESDTVKVSLESPSSYIHIRNDIEGYSLKKNLVLKICLLLLGSSSISPSERANSLTTCRASSAAVGKPAWSLTSTSVLPCMMKRWTSSSSQQWLRRSVMLEVSPLLLLFHHSPNAISYLKCQLHISVYKTRGKWWNAMSLPSNMIQN